MAKKDKNKKVNSKGKKKKNSGAHLVIVLLLVSSVVFLSSAIILYVGMIPTFVAFFVDRSKNKGKAMTVGAFNVIGCLPFVLKLWDGGLSMDLATEIILDPLTLVIIYLAAAFGYVMDWLVVSAASGALYKQGLMRLEAIKKRQAELIERWGASVSGDYSTNAAVRDEEDDGEGVDAAD
ncbi:MAG: hypothetical protein KTR28_07605 [Micavibrio sp.]|nr:hypothetical protein [Micavibrio sp.]